MWCNMPRGEKGRIGQVDGGALCPLLWVGDVGDR